jgi:hypothetical protein
MKKREKAIGEILFIVGGLLVLIHAFITEAMMQKGMLIFPQIVNLATFVYSLMYSLGYFFFGIIGLVMLIIGLVNMRD